MEAALAAFAAGKAVSLQKPVATTLEGADRLIAGAQRAGVPFRVFENFIFYPPVAKAKALVEAGAIGTPLTIRIKSNATGGWWGKGRGAPYGITLHNPRAQPQARQLPVDSMVNPYSWRTARTVFGEPGATTPMMGRGRCRAVISFSWSVWAPGTLHHMPSLSRSIDPGIEGCRLSNQPAHALPILHQIGLWPSASY